MARKKQAVPLQREVSDFDQGPPESSKHGWKHANGTAHNLRSTASAREPKEELLPQLPSDQAGFTQLVVCVAGIYASLQAFTLHSIQSTTDPSSSLTWALLQERITTTPYGPSTSPSRFTYSVFLNTIQSTFAAISGYGYLLFSNPRSAPTPAIFPSRSIFFPLALVAVTSSLASPFGYASLAHIDYITFILAKSCKLLPVMFLHLTIFRKRYPLYKYLVVALVTAGVAVFTLYNPSSSKKASASALKHNSSWGLLLLGINLLFDGLTNSTQDYIFSTFQPYSGPQMMVAQNVLSTILTVCYLFASPYLPIALSPSPNELKSALSFIRAHPAVGNDILLFCLCGAVGQIFIYYTLSKFSSLLLVTVTVTRKMLTMMLSVLWFGHRLSGMQWVGVGLVFGGVGAEGLIAKREKATKDKAKREKSP